MNNITDLQMALEYVENLEESLYKATQKNVELTKTIKKLNNIIDQLAMDLEALKVAYSLLDGGVNPLPEDLN